QDQSRGTDHYSFSIRGAARREPGHSRSLDPEGRRRPAISTPPSGTVVEQPTTTLTSFLSSGSNLNPDRCAYEAERGSYLIFQKSLIRKMELHLAIGKQDECRRSDGRLGQIENFYALADWDRGAVEVHMLEETVHLSGRNALAAFGGNLLERGEDFIGSLAFGG